MKERRKLWIVIALVVLVAGLRVGVLYRESLRYEAIPVTEKHPQMEGITITIEEPEVSLSRYIRTGELLSYTVTNDTETEFMSGVPPLDRVEQLQPDGTWLYWWPYDIYGNPHTPNAMGLPLYPGSTTETYTVTQKNLFTRLRTEKGTYRVAVDYFTGRGQDIVYYTAYARFTIS